MYAHGCVHHALDALRHEKNDKRNEYPVSEALLSLKKSCGGAGLKRGRHKCCCRRKRQIIPRTSERCVLLAGKFPFPAYYVRTLQRTALLMNMFALFFPPEAVRSRNTLRSRAGRESAAMPEQFILLKRQVSAWREGCEPVGPWSKDRFKSKRFQAYKMVFFCCGETGYSSTQVSFFA